MAKKTLKNALTTSLKAEDEAVRHRFEKAESLLNDTPRTAEQTTTEQKPQSTSSVPEKKVVRDAFTMPVDDYELIATIQQRCLQSALNVTKGEVLRAALKILNELSDENLTQAFKKLEKIKVGRPSGKK